MAQLAVQLAFAGLGNTLIPAGTSILGLSGAGIGQLVGSVVSSYLFPPPDVKNFGPRLSDLSITASTYGKTIPIVYGTVPVAGDIIDASEKYEKANKQTEEAGKGGGQEVSYTTYTYSIDLGIGLCEGPIVGLLQIFANETLIYDARQDAQFVKKDWLDFELYLGTETQEPDPTLEAIHGAGEVPAYRGLAYIVFKRFQLEEFGQQVPNFRFVVVRSGNLTVNESSIDLGTGTAQGPAYSEDTGLLYSSLDSTADPSNHHLQAIDPLSKNVVWTTSMTDPNGNTMYRLDKPEVVGEYVVVTGQRTTTGGKRRIAFVDANSGYVYDIQEMDQTTSVYYQHARPLYSDRLVFICPTDGLTSDDFLSIWTFSGVDFDQDYQPINNPSGWRLLADTPVGIKPGDTAILCSEIESTTTSNFGVAIWDDVDRPLSGSFTPTFTIVDLGSSITGIHQIYYNESTDKFWVKPSNATGKVEWFEVDPSGTYTHYDWDTLYSISEAYDANHLAGPEFENGYLWVQTLTKLYRWDISDPSTPVEYTNTTIDKDMIYIPVTSSFWGSNVDDLVEYKFDLLEPLSVSLSSIVDDLSDRVGVSQSDIDSSQLDSISVRGYVIANPTTARAALEPLRAAFLFDHSDTGSLIEFVPLGQSVTRALTINDVGAHADGQSPPAAVEIERIQESDLPKELAVTYMDVGANYELGHQRARKLATSSNQVITIELPIAFTHTETAQKAEILLHLAHIEREPYKVYAMPLHMDIDPANVVTVNDGINTFRMRITEKTFEEGVVKLSGVRDEPNVLVSNAQGAAIIGRDAVIFIAGVMQYELLNIPALRDADMAAGFYIAAYSYADSWPGGVLFRTTDGSSFAEVVTVDTESTAGRVWTPAEDASPAVIDYWSSLDISLYSGALESVTLDEMRLSGVNVAAYGADGRWEIIQYQSAVLESSGHYTVTNLIRGLLGTEYAIDQHQVGDLFIVLDSSSLERIVTNQADIGASFNYRGVTIGRSLFARTNIDKSHTHIGSGLLPYSPAHFTAETEADQDVVFTWVPRTRQIWRDFWTGIESDAELYDLEIYDGTTLLRTYSDLTSATATYTRAEQETDLGADTLDTITAKVYHKSATVGRGYEAELSKDLGPPPNTLKDYALTLSPYLYWLMDITSGTEVPSIGTNSGSNSDLDLYGGEAIQQTSLMNNLHGFSIRFNGADYAHPNGNPLASGTDKTTCFLIKIDGTPSSDHYIHYLYPADASGYTGVRMMLLSSRKIRWRVRNSGDTAWMDLDSTTALTVGEIYLVTASIGAAGQKLYINGSLEASDGTRTTHLTSTGSIRLVYGDDQHFGTPNIPDIYFDQIMYWRSKQLTDTEVNEIYIRT